MSAETKLKIHQGYLAAEADSVTKAMLSLAKISTETKVLADILSDLSCQLNLAIDDLHDSLDK